MAKRINSFKNLCQEDQIALLKGGCTEMMLLHSVSAYDPDKDSWKGSYLYLTRRYLQARYGTCLGSSIYHQLLHRLAHLHHLSEDHLRLFLEVNPTQVEPLLIEIFDLKQR
ncbi:Nuclear hormone receptor HR96 [Chionoecetes opilio]|uniref:Nuclear hormone receptor HR96 n=1 Tax=Chionoecetes opilio TaxID=41210 RepID=A0A8J4YHM7_CHIOP|nr:Nuclear hormone receptor HR96 [Chionoecetes opilio]